MVGDNRVRLRDTTPSQPQRPPTNGRLDSDAFDRVLTDLDIRRDDAPAQSAEHDPQAFQTMSKERVFSVVDEVMARPRAVIGLKELLKTASLENLQLAIETADQVHPDDKSKLHEPLLSALSRFLPRTNVADEDAIATVDRLVRTYGIDSSIKFVETMRVAASNLIENGHIPRAQAITLSYLGPDDIASLAPKVVQRIKSKNITDSLKTTESRKELMTTLSIYGIDLSAFDDAVSKHINDRIGKADLSSILELLDELKIDRGTIKPDIIRRLPSWAINGKNEQIAEYVLAFRITEDELRDVLSRINY